MTGGNYVKISDVSPASRILLYISMVTSLAPVLNASNSYVISVGFGHISHMFKQGVLPHEVDPEEEIFPGTKVRESSVTSRARLNCPQVPEVTDFPQETQVLAGLMDELKGEWKCATHGPCYIAPSGKHIPLTKFRLTGWASEIVGHLVTIPGCLLG